MIRHFFKLVWNRRRANSLILIELLISFLVLCGVLAVVVNYFDHWRQPLGFKYDRVWVLGTEREPFSMLDDEDKLANDQALKQGLRLLSAYNDDRFPKHGISTIWIITEADRSATTILFPDEY